MQEWRLHDGVEVGVPFGDLLGNAFADVGDAAGYQPAPERQLTRLCQCGHDLGRLFVAQQAAFLSLAEVESGKFTAAPVVEVERIVQPAAGHQRLGHPATEAFDIEGSAGGEVFETRHQTCRAGGVEAAMSHLGLQTGNGAAAGGAVCRHDKGGFAAAALFGNDALNGRNDITGLDDPDVVADTQVFARNLIGIMERGTGDGGAGQQHRLQLGDGGQDAGAPHLDRDIADRGSSALGFKFIGAGIARALGGSPERVVPATLIDLDDGAIDLKGEVVPQRLQLIEGCHHRRHVGAAPGAWWRGHSPAAQLR